MSKSIVLSRSLKPEWLDMTLEFWLENHDPKQTRDRLNDYLSQQIGSPTVLRKTREILMRTWVEVDDSLGPLRDMGVSVFHSCPSSERIAIHWVMLIAVFPLFKDLCGIIGKLTSIQDEFTTSQITRRIFELWGERTTLVHSLSKNIKTLKEFGAIHQRKPGLYERVRKPIFDERVIEFMLYGIIKSGDKLYHSVSEFERQKELFPFEFETNFDYLTRSNKLKLDRVGGELVVSI
jgi:hypothetical protein